MLKRASPMLLLSLACALLWPTSSTAAEAPAPPAVVLVAEPVLSSPGLAVVFAGPSAPGGAAVVSWATSGMDSCEGLGPEEWAGPKPLAGAASIGPIAEPAQYGLRCTGAAGTAERIWTLEAPTPPSLTLRAEPNIVTAGEPVVLLWEAEDVEACWGTGPAAWAGSKPLQGAYVVTPQATAVYGIECAAGPYGRVADAAQVLVSLPPPPPPEPTVALTADPTVVDVGEGTRLTWSSSDAASCRASGAWSGEKPINGSELSGPLFTDATFSLACDSAMASVMVSVIVPPPPPPPSKPLISALSVIPGTIKVGHQTTVRWTTSYAERCASRLLVWNGVSQWVDYSGAASWPSPDKPLEGGVNGEKLGPLPAMATAYLVNLSCSNSLGTTSKTVTLWVQ